MSHTRQRSHTTLTEPTNLHPAPQVSSDLVDEDSYIHNRDKSLSASLVGMVFFFSKFSQSIAPAIG